MCGIVGFVYLKHDLEIERYKHVLSNMINKISKYNIDKDNIYYTNHVMLSGTSNHSFNSLNFEGNTYTILYNGNLYNFNELKDELLEKGFSFESHSHTEVLLKAYICFGYDIVNKLNGVFSFAIWNENKEELFFARDHFGVKPFYYSLKENNFVFASEIKAILEFPRN